VSPVGRSRGINGSNATNNTNTSNGTSNTNGLNTSYTLESNNNINPLTPENLNLIFPTIVPRETNTNSVNNIESNNNNPESLLGRKRESDNELIEPEHINQEQNEREHNLSVSSFDMVIEEYVEDEGNVSNTESD
jgi:hypothetical protein